MVKMTHLQSVLFLIIFIVGVFCADDTPIADLPAEIIQELSDIIANNLTLREECGPPNINVSDVRFMLYTRSNPNTPIILNASGPVEVDTAKKIVFISHGWMSGSNQSYFPLLKNASLQRYDCNVIMVDWAPIAAELYTSAYCNLPAVGVLLGKFLCLLAEQYGVVLSIVHLIGHSLGAHASGFAGQYTQSTCGRILGRISALDPAGPLFQGLAPASRIDSSDATFVDVYHSNQLVFGYAGPCGTVDFYLNGGTVQPGCVSVSLSNLTSSTVGDVGCSHSFCMKIYAESINAVAPALFIAKACPLLCVVGLTPPEYIVAGEDCPRNPTNHEFILPTKNTSPYAAGCDPYISGCSI